MERLEKETRSHAFPIPSTEYAKALHRNYGEAALNPIRIYDTLLDEDISQLFKYALRDIDD